MTTSAIATNHLPLPQLADPDRYVPCVWDLRADADKREHWLMLFRNHFPKMMEHAILEAADRGENPLVTRGKCARATELFFAYLDRAAREHQSFITLDILEICYERERVMRAVGISDPYRLAKSNEGLQAMAMLPEVLAELDSLPADDRAMEVIKGIFAGNIFDLGATRTADLFAPGRPFDFHATVESLRARPWIHDDLDPWLGRMASGPLYRKAVVFADNAGPDVLLGMLPFVRDLLFRGTKIILTVNTYPSLNDITYDEMVPLIHEVAAWDPMLSRALKDGRLRIAPSGNDAPLIDLRRLSPQLVSLCDDEVDLVVLEGMGRAVESNWDARFKTDSLKVAMIKEGGVAYAFGWRVYDLVFKFEPARRA